MTEPPPVLDKDQQAQQHLEYGEEAYVGELRALEVDVPILAVGPRRDRLHLLEPVV